MSNCSPTGSLVLRKIERKRAGTNELLEGSMRRGSGLRANKYTFGVQGYILVSRRVGL